MCDVPQYFYYEDEHVLVDECGDLVERMYEIFHPNIIYLLCTKKENMFVYTNQGKFVELIYEGSYVYLFDGYNIPIDKIERRMLNEW